MRNKILFLSEAPRNDFDTSLCDLYSLRMDYIAECIGESRSIPESVSNIPIENNTITFTKENIEDYFKNRFNAFKQMSADTTVEKFCNSQYMQSVKKAIEEERGLYASFVDEECEPQECIAETMDEFVRETYKFVEDCPKQKFYIIGCLEYHA